MAEFDDVFYTLIGLCMTFGGFFLFHFYMKWAKQQSETSSADNALIRGTTLVLIAGFGITLQGITIIYSFGLPLLKTVFRWI